MGAVRGAVTDVIAARTQDDGGLERRFVYSLAAHLFVGIACILIASNFPSGTAKQNVIEVSYAGSQGARTSGVAPIAGTRVDQEAPNDPIKPAPPPKPDTMPAPSAKSLTPTPVPPPNVPATGKQLRSGTAVVETGTTGTSPGITQTGGDGTGGTVDLNGFDEQWTRQMKASIEKQWNNLQPETGWSEVLFEVGRDGKLLTSNLGASSGSFLLNQEALRAIRTATLPPLPPDYLAPTLRVRLRFNYGIK